MNSFQSDNIESKETRHFDETDSWGERWDDFEEMFEDFDPAPIGMEGVWMESDMRQRALELIRKRLEEGDDKSPFGDDEALIKGLKSSLGYFSFVQLEELQRLVDHIGEGLAEERQQQRFEKSSKTEQRD